MSRRLVFWLLTLAAVVVAVAQAWVLRWTCDDAFISFRYAQHFAEGHGLVFNLDPSEAPVEGYTNFTWTVLLALGVMLGNSDRALENWSILWGIAAHAGTVLLLAMTAWRASHGRAALPIAALGYAVLHHAASLAPAGLETALFVLLAAAMLRLCLAMRCAREAWLLGFLGVFAAMTRPDGAIFAAVAGLFVLHDAFRRGAPKLLLGYVLPFVMVFVPYLLWRHAYYGHWVPNTFFAKSGTGSYVPQGLRYVGPFFACYWPLLLGLLPLGWFLAKKPDPLATISPFVGRRPWVVLAAFVLPYLGFVIWVGGDFMFARFLLPIVPALLLAADFACQRWRPIGLQVAWAAVLALGFSLRVEPAGLDRYENDVSDNRTISMPLVDVARGMGEYLQWLFAGLDVRLGIAGAHASLAYRSRAPVAIECAAGLTDAFIARLPVPPGGKRGHDRPWTLYPDYLVQRGVQIMFELSYGRDANGQDIPWRWIMFPTPAGLLPAKLVQWDGALMDELRRREPHLQVVDFPSYLDEYIAELPQKTKAQVQADLAQFETFYFVRNDDPARRRAFEPFLR
ncbi:MAG: hypothetical protein JNN13_02430 [Planctomycetes bacterium]|nr:hypothetical protein [Planctomycetota bacterium]